MFFISSGRTLTLDMLSLFSKKARTEISFSYFIDNNGYFLYDYRVDAVHDAYGTLARQ